MFIVYVTGMSLLVQPGICPLNFPQKQIQQLTFCNRFQFELVKEVRVVVCDKTAASLTVNYEIMVIVSWR